MPTKPFFQVMMLNLLVVVSIASCAETHPPYAKITRIENDLSVITQTEKARNYEHPDMLNQVASYIFDELQKTCDTVYFQKYVVYGVTYINVVGVLGNTDKEKLVVGAHYDVAGEQQGADDNASGVAGMLELSRLLANEPLDFHIEFVAYTLEEPPFFRSDDMGSHIHARSLYDNNIQIKGMICLEMIGYFNDEKKSQDYPIKALKAVYGNKGDFITVVQKSGGGKFGKQITRGMKKPDLIETKSFKGPEKLPGIDFSDHRNYWKYNYDAVMITNTAFYRNKNYHKPTDTMETLDLKRMALVIDEVYLAIKEL